MTHPDNQAENHRLARHLVSILQSYIQELPYDAPQQGVLATRLEEISGIIGPTPTIHQEPSLPEDFVPDNYPTKKKQWKKKSCPRPIRGREKDQIHFIKLRDKASIRLKLKDQAEKTEVEVFELEGKKFFLNLTDFAYYEPELLHADHLVPSAELIDRQLEIIEVMNLNPRFKAAMLAKFRGSGFFLEKGKKVVGSQWFYMSFHNSTHNIWFLVASENIGRKGAKNPMEWLREIPLGREFLAAHGGDIDSSELLHTLRSGQPLCEAFTTWVKEKKSQNIKLARVHGELYRETVASIQQSTDPRQLRYARLSMRTDQIRQKRRVAEGDAAPAPDAEGASEESSTTSLSSANSEEVAERIAEHLDTDPEFTHLSKAMKKRRAQLEKKAIRDAKTAKRAKERAAAKSFKAVQKEHDRKRKRRIKIPASAAPAPEKRLKRQGPR